AGGPQAGAATVANRSRPATSSLMPIRSLPFDGGGGLGADVVGDAVDALHFVDDARAELGEQVVGQPGPVGGHAVGGAHGAHHAGFFVGAVVAHHADAAHGQQHGEGLPDGVVEAG